MEIGSHAVLLSLKSRVLFVSQISRRSAVLWCSHHCCTLTNGDILMDRILPDSGELNKTMMESSLADFMQEVGYGFCARY